MVASQKKVTSFLTVLEQMIELKSNNTHKPIIPETSSTLIDVALGNFSFNTLAILFSPSPPVSDNHRWRSTPGSWGNEY